MAVAPSQRRAAPKQRFGRPLLGRLSAGVARRERRAEKPEPEPTLASKPLRGGGVPGPLADSGGAGWELELDDEHRRSFVSLRREAFSERTLRQWWSALYSKIDWECPMVGKRRMPRSAAWLTSAQCKCTYRYGSAAFTSLGMEPWFQEITDLVCEVCGIQQDPNSCNANLYEDGAQAVGWHADDEPLFEATERDALIVSLSLGATRAFELRPNDAPGEVTRLSLHHGDLCTMEGLTQKHYRHRVPRGPATKPRINLTWRWVVAHDRGCPLRQPGRTAEDVMSSPSPTRLPPAPRPTKRPHPETTSSLAFAEISKEEKERREQRLSRFSAASGALGPGAPAAPRPAAAEVAKRRRKDRFEESAAPAGVPSRPAGVAAASGEALAPAKAMLAPTPPRASMAEDPEVERRHRRLARFEIPAATPSVAAPAASLPAVAAEVAAPPPAAGGTPSISLVSRAAAALSSVAMSAMTDEEKKRHRLKRFVS